MPMQWQNEAERKGYYSSWWKSPKGMELRKRTILRRALERGAFPTANSIRKYALTAEDLTPIVELIGRRYNQAPPTEVSFESK